MAAAASLQVELVDEEEWAGLEAAIAAAEQARPCPAAEQAPPKRARTLPASLAAAKPEAAAGAAEEATLDPLRYTGALTYAHTAIEVDWLCEKLLASGVTVFGCDIEWKVRRAWQLGGLPRPVPLQQGGFMLKTYPLQVTYETGVAPRPVALVQLCYSSAAPDQPPPQQPDAGGGARYSCLLLHVSSAGMTANLRRLLCSEAVTKVGVGLHGDGLKLQRDFGFEPHGVLDLGGAFAHARLAGAGEAAPAKWSLAGLTARLLRRALPKAQGLRCSDWERVPLTPEQRAYAAADAYASLAVYEVGYP